METKCILLEIFLSTQELQLGTIWPMEKRGLVLFPHCWAKHTSQKPTKKQ